MKLVPKRDQMIGRLLITKMESTIVVPDATKGVTKMILIQAVGPDAEAAGYKPGDIVIPNSIRSMFLRAGTQHVVYCEVKDVIFTVEELSPDEVVDGDGKTAIKSLDPKDASHQGRGASLS